MRNTEYIRVIPRDLFNEANLKKCYGQIYLNLEKTNLPHVKLEHDGAEFVIVQDELSGSLSIVNVQLIVDGEPRELFRPLNSREPWPLWLRLYEEDIPVFNDKGSFSEQMTHFLTGNPS